MEELQNLINFLKAKGLKHQKIPLDVWIGIIEYFASNQEKQCDIPVVGSSAKPRKKTKKCDYCQKRKNKDNMYFLYKEGVKQYWICDDCNLEHDIV